MKPKLKHILLAMLPGVAFTAEVHAQLPNAWQITHNTTAPTSTLYYTNQLTFPQQVAATNSPTGGFRFSVNARLVTDFDHSETMTMIYGLGSKRFLIWWDLDSNDNLTARLENGITYTLTTNGTGSALYHTHEIIFTNGAASYVFDGVIKTNNWLPSGNTWPAGTITWGAGSSSGEGQMNFNRVSFAVTNTVVAEYNAGTEPTNAPDPRTQGWTISPSIPPSGTSTNGVSPDRGPGVVTTLADSGYGSLRQAITDAQSGDTIGFFTNGTLLLTSGQLAIAKNLTIIGPGPASLSLDGNKNRRVFQILSGAMVSISGLTITNGQGQDGSTGSPGSPGNSGGGIANAGTLTLSNCVIVGNSTGNGGHGDSASYPDILSGGYGGAGGNGGGIFSSGTLTLISCSLSDNRCGSGGDGGKGYYGVVGHADGYRGGDGGPGGHGGGIYGSGTTTLIACTLTRNDAGFGGEGGNGGDGNPQFPIFASNGGPGGNGGDGGDGGGLYFASGTASLANCTLYRNIPGSSGSLGGSGGNAQATGSAGSTGSEGQGGIGGAAYINNSTNTINCSTIVDHYGFGIYGGLNKPVLALTNSIVTTARSSSQFVGAIVFYGEHNLTNSGLLLAPLGNYGGPTATMPPTAGSPAIDAGTDSISNSLAADQRGYPRWVGAHVDIGAVEVGRILVTNTNDDGPGSLRQAIADNSSAETISFAPFLSGQTINLTSGQLTNATSLGIDASALAGGLILDAGHNSRIFRVTPGTLLSLVSLTLRNGHAVGSSSLEQSGGAILLDFSALGLILDRCSIVLNHAEGNGGGIAVNPSARVFINNSTLSANQADGDGGGIAHDGTLLILNNSTLSSNQANGNGGGIAMEETDAILNNSTLSANQAAGKGGGLYGPDLAVAQYTNTIVAGNTTSGVTNNIHGRFLTVTNFFVNSIAGGNPLLAPLGNYGGPTQTMPPLHGSPAIDAGLDSITNSLLADQRGYSRKSGAHVDIGAAEAQLAATNNPPFLIIPAGSTGGGGSDFRLMFTNVPNADFTVLASTNVALPSSQWTPLGLTTQNAPGQYQFTDPSAANYPQRFYQIVAP